MNELKTTYKNNFVSKSKLKFLEKSIILQTLGNEVFSVIECVLAYLFHVFIMMKIPDKLVYKLPGHAVPS